LPYLIIQKFSYGKREFSNSPNSLTIFLHRVRAKISNITVYFVQNMSFAQICSIIYINW